MTRDVARGAVAWSQEMLLERQSWVSVPVATSSTLWATSDRGLSLLGPGEPLDVAPPSPHSIVWTARVTFASWHAPLLALGAIWGDRADAREGRLAARALRFGCRSAVAFGMHVVTRFTVPISRPSQGLLPAVSRPGDQLPLACRRACAVRTPARAPWAYSGGGARDILLERAWPPIWPSGR